MGRRASGRARTTQTGAGHPLAQWEDTRLSRPPHLALHLTQATLPWEKNCSPTFPGQPQLLPPQGLSLDFDCPRVSTVRGP